MSDPIRYSTDADGNQISSTEKIIAGFILIPLICACITLIISLWPDWIPPANENFQTYCHIKLFKVRVISIPNNAIDKIYQDSSLSNLKAKQALAKKLDSATTKGADNKMPTEATVNQVANDARGKTPEQIKKMQDAFLGKAAAAKQEEAAKQANNPCCTATVASNVSTGENNPNLLIDPAKFKKLSSLNTLYLILVVIGGFLGNLIHITTSLATFIGSGQFKRSWLLWYVSKPFIASGLALSMYFAIIGGFLSVSNSANNINIVGVMIISILSGLFTDRTTLKLKELFEVLLHPKDERTGPLVGDVKATEVNPLVISRQTSVPITITGDNFVKENLVLLINNQPQEMVVSPKAIVVNYSASVLPLGINRVTLVLKTNKGVILLQNELIIHD